MTQTDTAQLPQNFAVPPVPYYSVQPMNQPSSCQYVVQPGVVTEQVHNYTDDFLKKIGNVARAALQPNESVALTVTEANFFVRMAFMAVAVLADAGFESARGGMGSRNNLAAMLVGVVSIVVGGVFLFVFNAKNKDLTNQLNALQKVATEAWNYNLSAYEPAAGDSVEVVETKRSVLNNLADAMNRAEAILKRNKLEMIKKIAFVAIPFIVGGVACVVGAIYALPVVIGIGAVALLGASAYGIYKLVDKSDEKANIEDALVINHRIYELTGKYPEIFPNYHLTFTTAPLVWDNSYTTYVIVV